MTRPHIQKTEETFYDFITEGGLSPQIEDYFLALSFNSEYWETAYKFYIQNQERLIQTFTEAQKRWALKIKEDLYEKFIDGF